MRARPQQAAQAVQQATARRAQPAWPQDAPRAQQPPPQRSQRQRAALRRYSASRRQRRLFARTPARKRRPKRARARPTPHGAPPHRAAPRRSAGPRGLRPTAHRRQMRQERQKALRRAQPQRAWRPRQRAPRRRLTARRRAAKPAGRQRRRSGRQPLQPGLGRLLHCHQRRPRRPAARGARRARRAQARAPARARPRRRGARAVVRCRAPEPPHHRYRQPRQWRGGLRRSAQPPGRRAPRCASALRSAQACVRRQQAARARVSTRRFLRGCSAACAARSAIVRRPAARTAALAPPGPSLGGGDARQRQHSVLPVFTQVGPAVPLLPATRARKGHARGTQGARTAVARARCGDGAWTVGEPVQSRYRRPLVDAHPRIYVAATPRAASAQLEAHGPPAIPGAASAQLDPPLRRPRTPRSGF